LHEWRLLGQVARRRQTLRQGSRGAPGRLGSPILAEQVEAKLAAGQFDALTLIHNETSTGTMSPVYRIAALKEKFPDVMFIVDAVSSMSAVKLEFDALR
jgi:aspartate aminotransferase-like enzyme